MFYILINFLYYNNINAFSPSKSLFTEKLGIMTVQPFIFMTKLSWFKSDAELTTNRANPYITYRDTESTQNIRTTIMCGRVPSSINRSRNMIMHINAVHKDSLQILSIFFFKYYFNLYLN